MYRYHLTNRNCSSERLGNCEVCHKPVAEVHLLTEQRQYTRSDNSIGWSHHHCLSKFGHKDCLTALQK